MKDFDKKLDENKDSENAESENEFAYKSVMDGKPKMRTWSVVSVILATVSVIFSILVWQAGIALGFASIVSAIVSRKSLGYFDKLSLGGLIGAIFGIVFSVATWVYGIILLA